MRQACQVPARAGRRPPAHPHIRAPGGRAAGRGDLREGAVGASPNFDGSGPLKTGAAWKAGDAGQAIHRVSHAVLPRRCQRALREALRCRRRKQVFLDLFPGSRSASKEIENQGEWGVVRLDLVDDDAFDMTNPAVNRLIKGWISSRVVR
eukprot:4350892-Pyramimonas_sp.AAC.1